MNRAEILELIPHAGAMCLLNEVVAWDAQNIHCRSISHRDENHPLRHNDRLAVIHLVEYAAQAVAVHGGLLAHNRNEHALAAGRLASLRDVEFNGVDTQNIESALDIHAYRELAGTIGLIYRFTLYGDQTILASGQLTIIGH